MHDNPDCATNAFEFNSKPEDQLDNRAGEMEVFIRVAELRSFSEAGRKLHLSPSAVSKLVTRIEDRLATRLLVRSTRGLQLTPEGEMYLVRAQRVLDEIDDAERAVASGGKAAPRGRLRVNASIAFGVMYVQPLIPAFLARYPEVELDFSLTDGIIDLLEERADIAIRSGSLPDSSLKARKLIESSRTIVASPEYIAKRGLPGHPDELDSHNCLRFNFPIPMNEWPFINPDTGERFGRTVSGNFLCDSGPAMRRLCLSGLGMARLGRFHVQGDLKAGTLVEILPDWNPNDEQLIHAIFAGHEHLAARIRAFIDFLVNHIDPHGNGIRLP
ncbi:MAG: LysR family transcriptional regulator [Thalassospira sp.]|nr:LysR family transcriptional regulator [Thalassospira sp.]